VRTNVVLVDFESVQPRALDTLLDDHYRVVVFVGATQAKLPFEVVSTIQRLGERAEYVKITGSGPNALDFHIAFYIGQIAAHDPTAFFHVISKDTGFDPLIRHLKDRHIFAARSASIEEMPRVKISDKQAASERARVFAQSLRQRGATKPRTDTSLARHISAYFAKLQPSEAEVAAIIDAMHGFGVITIADSKVNYSL
jgi:hypothetical protein